MEGSTNEAVAQAVRTAEGSLVVAGDAGHRAAAARAGCAGDHVLEVGPAAAATGWSGLAAVLDACRWRAPRLPVPAALEAAATGRAVGDHLGLAADLCTLLARLGEDGSWTVVIHDAHRMDVSSAAALSRALAGAPDGVRAVVTQDRSGRGVDGVPMHVVGGGDVGDHATALLREPAQIEAAKRGAAEAARVGAVLDAAAGAEAVGDWAAAAAWWLQGGRPDRCRRALARAGVEPLVAEVAARLAHRTGSEGERRTTVDAATAVLDGRDPLASARLRLLEAGARIRRGDADAAEALVVAAGGVLARVERGPAERAVRELHDVVQSTCRLVRDGDVAGVMRSVERPLARLGAHDVDADAVELLAVAAMPLGRRDHLDEARALLDRVIGVLDGRRRFVLLARPLATSAWLARRRGRLDLARTHGARAIDIARACGWTSDERVATVEVARVAAAQGRLADRRRQVSSLVPPGTVGSRDVDVPVGGATTTALSIEDLRVALALAEGADVEDVAALRRLTPRRVEEARDRIMDLLHVDAVEDLDRLVLIEQPVPAPAVALVRVLGPAVVQRGDQQLVPPAGRPAAVLALVATEGSIALERVLDLLWPDAEPGRSRPRLRNVLARLRAAVGPVVERDGDRLVLAPGVEVDARNFERLADDALKAPADDVLARTEEALAAWVGEPLVSWPYEDWALRERHRLIQRCVALRLRRADVLAALGAVGSALDELEQAVAMQPEARDLWERAVGLAEADERIGRALALRRRAAHHDIELV